LQRLAASAAALALEPFSGIVVTGDVYRNARLSLTVQRPLGWDFSSIADFAALRDRQVLQEVIDRDPHPLKDPHNLPVFLFENPSFCKGQFAPSISLWDEPLDGPVPPDQSRAHEEVMLEGFASAYRDVHIEEHPVAVQLKGTGATVSRWSYSHDLDSGEEYRLTVQSVLVFREPRVHTYHLVDSGIAPTIDRAVWKGFLDSISYDS
jgi:hypothetical protein